MIESVEKLHEILEHVGSHITTPCTAYLIGGGAFMMHGLKDATRDIDLCADNQTVHYIISELRERNNLWTCNIGHDQFLFLQIFLSDFQDVTLELFCNNEFKLLEDRPYSTRKYGKLEIRLPDVKGLLKLKDKQMKRMLEELGRERCMRRLEPE